MKHLLGSDAEFLVKNVKKSLEKKERSDDLQVNIIYRAVKYFEEKMEKRRNWLKTNMKYSRIIYL